MEEGSESANAVLRTVCVYMGGPTRRQKPFLNYRRSDQRCSYPLLARPTATPLSPPPARRFISSWVGFEKSDNGCVVALCGDVNTFHSNSLSHRRIPKGERGRAGRAILQENGVQSEQRRERGRRVEWNRHTFLAMFAAMTIYLSAAHRAAALPAAP